MTKTSISNRYKTKLPSKQKNKVKRYSFNDNVSIDLIFNVLYKSFQI